MPETLCSSSGVLAGDYVYVLGGWSKRKTPSSACCIQVQNRGFDEVYNSTKCSKRLRDTPRASCSRSNMHSFPQHLDSSWRANSVAVHDIGTYNPDSKCWKVIVYLTKPQYICFAIGLPHKLIVLGGKDITTKENMIEILQ